MTAKTQEPKQYWLQLREEGLRVRKVRHVGTEALPDGDKLILLEADTWTGVRLWALEKSKFDVDWRTWTRPPEIGWLMRAFSGRHNADRSARMRWPGGPWILIVFLRGAGSIPTQRANADPDIASAGEA